MEVQKLKTTTVESSTIYYYFPFCFFQIIRVKGPAGNFTLPNFILCTNYTMKIGINETESIDNRFFIQILHVALIYISAEKRKR
jgi:hypothetical protein